MTKTKTLKLNWDEYSNKRSRGSDLWSATDRGWLHLPFHQHPLAKSDPSRLASLKAVLSPKICACVGYYLDYETSANEDGSIIASAYLPTITPGGYSSIELGVKYFKTIEAAKEWIEARVTEHISGSSK